MSWKKLVLYSLFGFVLLTLLFLVISNIWIVQSTKHLVYNSVDHLADNDVALVLGTSKQLTSGHPNPYFEYRISAAVNLYQSGKVKHIIVSGDNRTIYYNEPIDMKNALIKKGIPENDITLDYAGIRTLDSVIRCKKIFGQNNFIIITQQFHAYRALFISNYYNIDAKAYAAGNLLNKSLKVLFREFFARPKAVIDLYITGKQPKFLGEKEYVKINE